MGFPYFHDEVPKKYAFYRIPKVLFSDECFARLSLEAKFLYAMMLDRMEISIKNGWRDKEGRAYIYFTMDEAMELLQCKTEKVVKIFAELDERNGVGLIETVRQGFGKPNRIYVKNFMDNPSIFD